MVALSQTPPKKKKGTRFSKNTQMDFSIFEVGFRSRFLDFVVGFDFQSSISISRFRFLVFKIQIFQKSQFWVFQIFIQNLHTLKPHNFLAIGSILKILDVPESSRPVLSHNRIYFLRRFHESSSKRWIRFRNRRF